MPIYQYRCNDCGHEFEKRQRMSDDPLSDCPLCEGTVRRVVNSVGVVFKGSGFYITDSRKGSNSAMIGAESGKNAEGGKTAESSNGTAEKATSDSKTTKSETSKATTTA